MRHKSKIKDLAVGFAKRFMLLMLGANIAIALQLNTHCCSVHIAVAACMHTVLFCKNESIAIE
jgi:hypothetical protein